MAESLKIITVDFQSPTATGDLDIVTSALDGLTPKAVLFTGSRTDSLGTAGDGDFNIFGVADGTNEYAVFNSERLDYNYSDTHQVIRDDACIFIDVRYGETIKASFVQFLSTSDTGTNDTGVRINFSNADNAEHVYRVTFLAGDDLSAAAELATMPSSGTATQTAGFEPDVVLTESALLTTLNSTEAGYQYNRGWAVNDGATSSLMIAHATASRSGIAYSRPVQYLSTQGCVCYVDAENEVLDWQVGITNWTSTGFDFEVLSGSPNGEYVPWLAIKWGTLGVTTTIDSIGSGDTGTHVLGDFSFEPTAAFIIGSKNGSTDTVEASSDSETEGLTVVGSDGVMKGFSSANKYDDPLVAHIIQDGFPILNPDGTYDMEASFSQYTSSGVEIDITTAPPNNRRPPLLVFEAPSASTAVSVTASPQAQPATLDAQANRTVLVRQGPKSQPATLDASAIRVATATGSPQAQPATLNTSLTRVVWVTASPQAQPASTTAQTVRLHTLQGTFQALPATLETTLTVIPEYLPKGADQTWVAQARSSAWRAGQRSTIYRAFRRSKRWKG